MRSACRRTGIPDAPRLANHHDRPALALRSRRQHPIEGIVLAFPAEQHLSSPLLTWAFPQTRRR